MTAPTVRDPAVLVVGAGPVGLLLACELARRGVAVRIIDKLPSPTSESRAIIVHARSLEMMERVGVAEEVISTGLTVKAAELHLDGTTAARVPLDTVDSPYPFSVTLPQTETERILAERLRELGVEVERGTELVAFDQDDRVEASLRLADGRQETAGCAFIVGADGSHSTVRSAAGTRLEGTFVGEKFLLADVEADYDLDRGAMHSFFAADESPLILFPMRGERLRVIAQLTDSTLSKREPTLSDAQEVVDRQAGGVRLLRAHWLTVFEIHHAQVPSYRYGRAFLAGDAAHVHSPAGGQGMNTGMQDAFNLGWKLAAAVRGVASTELLQSYHAERHPIAERVIAQTTRMTSIGTLSRRSERVLRDHLVHLAAGLAPFRHEMAREMEETGINYRGSPIVLGSGRHFGGPRPGDAAPDVPGVYEGRPLHGLLSEEAGHTLLWVARNPRELDGARSGVVFPPSTHVRYVAVATEEFDGSPFDAAVVDPGASVARRYGVGDHGELFAVRPDGYVGLRTRIDDPSRLRDYVAKLYRVPT